MLLRCSVLLFCLTAICAQKGGRQASTTVEWPSPSIWGGREIPQASESIQQVTQDLEDSDPPQEDQEVPVAVLPQRPILTPPSRPYILPQPARAVLPPPARLEVAESDPGGHPAPEPYSFAFKTDDPETGAASSREETQDINGEVVGFYHIQDAEGRMRRVDYTAGKEGFKANIRSNEEGLNSIAPADVTIDHSGSELRPTVYTPNNRPSASEARPLVASEAQPVVAPQKFQLLQRSVPVAVPAPVAPTPIRAPPTQETRRFEQAVQQKEDPAKEAKISQTYETSDSQEIVQQKNVDEEVVFESSRPQPLYPVKGGPLVQPQTQIWSAPPQPQQQRGENLYLSQAIQSISPQLPVQTWSAPPQQQVGQFNPSRIVSYREQGAVSLNSQPITQVRQEIPNIIDTQPLERTPSVRIAPLATYNELRPLAPVVPAVNARPVPSVTPQFVQFQQRGQAVTTVHQSVPNLVPLNHISNNIALQHREHREPVSQQRYLNYLQPQSAVSLGQSPGEISIAPMAVRPLELSLPLPQKFSYYPQQPQQQLREQIDLVQSQPINANYRVVVNHRENQQLSQPRQQVIQQRFLEPQQPQQPQQQVIQRRFVAQQPLQQPLQQIQQLVPPPAPQPLPQVNLPLIPYQYQPLPSPPQQIQIQRQPLFEPQVYEPLQQTYEPLQQVKEDPAEESRVETPSEKQAATIPQPIKGLSAPSEPQPVKSGRLSPIKAHSARSFLPRAFQSS